MVFGWLVNSRVHAVEGPDIQAGWLKLEVCWKAEADSAPPALLPSTYLTIGTFQDLWLLPHPWGDSHRHVGTAYAPVGPS